MMTWRTIFLPKPRALIQRFAILAAAFPVIGWIGGGYWILDVCNHFQFQYATFLALSALLLLVIKAFREAMVVAVLFMIPLVRIAPSYFPPAEVASSGNAIRVVSFNVLVSNHQHDATLRWVLDTDPDCIYFTETTVDWAKALQSLSNTYPHSIEEGTGFAFYSKFPITRHKIVRCSEYRFPLLIAHIATPNGEVAFFGIHPLPPVSRRWAQALDETMVILAREVSQEPGPLIVAGDFNITRWSHMGRPLDQAGLLDASRGKSPGTTWNRSNPLVTIPIDRILFRGQNMQCRSFSIGEDLGSDHRPVVAEIAW
jgi:endonuclease/exonuclease/phosphatase (EEP) superfamily protein YafD